MSKKKFSNEELIRYHQKGNNDHEIARALRVSCSAVRTRRNKLDLNPNKYQKFSDVILYDLYQKGLNDHEIAKIVECSPSTVQLRRKKLGLKSKFKYGKKWREKQSKAHTGKQISEDTKRKRSETLKKGKDHPRWKGGKKLSKLREHCKKRNLGSIILNPQDCKGGMTGHHITNEIIVFLPEKFHKKYYGRDTETHRKRVREDPTLRKLIENAIDNYKKVDRWIDNERTQ